MNQEMKQKAAVILSGAADGAAVGGLSRISATGSTVLLYLSLVGGLFGSFGATGTLARIAEGLVTTASGLFMAGLTAKANTPLRSVIKPVASKAANEQKLVRTRENVPSTPPLLEGGIVF